MENAEVTLKSAIESNPMVIELSESLRELEEKRDELFQRETALLNLKRNERHVSRVKKIS